MGIFKINSKYILLLLLFAFNYCAKVEKLKSQVQEPVGEENITDNPTEELKLQIIERFNQSLLGLLKVQDNADKLMQRYKHSNLKIENLIREIDEASEILKKFESANKKIEKIRKEAKEIKLPNAKTNINEAELVKINLESLRTKLIKDKKKVLVKIKEDFLSQVGTLKEQVGKIQEIVSKSKNQSEDLTLQALTDLITDSRKAQDNLLSLNKNLLELKEKARKNNIDLEGAENDIKFDEIKKSKADINKVLRVLIAYQKDAIKKLESNLSVAVENLKKIKIDIQNRIKENQVQITNSTRNNTPAKDLFNELTLAIINSKASQISLEELNQKLIILKPRNQLAQLINLDLQNANSTLDDSITLKNQLKNQINNLEEEKNRVGEGELISKKDRIEASIDAAFKIVDKEKSRMNELFSQFEAAKQKSATGNDRQSNQDILNDLNEIKNDINQSKSVFEKAREETESAKQEGTEIIGIDLTKAELVINQASQSEIQINDKLLLLEEVKIISQSKIDILDASIVANDVRIKASEAGTKVQNAKTFDEYEAVIDSFNQTINQIDRSLQKIQKAQSGKCNNCLPDQAKQATNTLNQAKDEINAELLLAMNTFTLLKTILKTIKTIAYTAYDDALFEANQFKKTIEDNDPEEDPDSWRENALKQWIRMRVAYLQSEVFLWTAKFDERFKTYLNLFPVKGDSFQEILDWGKSNRNTPSLDKIKEYSKLEDTTTGYQIIEFLLLEKKEGNYRFPFGHHEPSWWDYPIMAVSKNFTPLIKFQSYNYMLNIINDIIEHLTDLKELWNPSSNLTNKVSLTKKELLLGIAKFLKEEVHNQKLMALVKGEAADFVNTPSFRSNTTIQDIYYNLQGVKNLINGEYEYTRTNAQVSLIDDANQNRGIKNLTAETINNDIEEILTGFQLKTDYKDPNYEGKSVGMFTLGNASNSFNYQELTATTFNKDSYLGSNGFLEKIKILVQKIEALANL